MLKNEADRLQAANQSLLILNQMSGCLRRLKAKEISVKVDILGLTDQIYRLMNLSSLLSDYAQDCIRHVVRQFYRIRSQIVAGQVDTLLLDDLLEMMWLTGNVINHTVLKHNEVIKVG